MLIVLGLCFGSFINALVWRLHEQAKKSKTKPKKDLSITKGRSMCPHCKHTLAAKDLLPLLSWLWLHGKCRYCKKAIGVQYPLVEALTALLFVVSYAAWPFDLQIAQGKFQLAIWLVVLVILVALAVYDWRWMLLPDRLTYPLLGLAVGQVVVIATIFGGGWNSVALALGGAAVAGGIFFVLYQVPGKQLIGGGDVKMGWSLGLLLGTPWLAMVMLFAASLLGLAAALPGILQRKLGASSQIPFGPFLIAATVLTMLWGQQIIDTYVRLMAGV